MSYLFKKSGGYIKISVFYLPFIQQKTRFFYIQGSDLLHCSRMGMGAAPCVQKASPGSFSKKRKAMDFIGRNMENHWIFRGKNQEILGVEANS